MSDRPLPALADEPVAFSVFENEDKRLVSFSDLPEQVIPGLVQVFGADAVAAAISPSDVELEFYKSLPLSTRTRARYLDLVESGELERRVHTLDKAGVIPKRVPYFMACINRSDEPILGRTGAIYFVCKKGCHFCQYRGFDERTLSPEEIADRMLMLQANGADNIQWVSPTQHTRALLKATLIAAQRGLTLPIVHKSEGEDSLSELGLFAGVVDMYLPDAKFINAEFADKVGLPPSYGKRMQDCIREMYKQVGPLTRAPGEALLQGGGMLVRHLIMPGGVAEANAVFTFLEKLDPALPIHVMTTYQPLHDAATHPDIARHVTHEEVVAVAEAAHELELSRVYVR